MKNYVYVAICVDDRGWADADEDAMVWACGPEDRIFATAWEARSMIRGVLREGCWRSLDRETGEEIHVPPVLAVERRAVYEWLWGDHSEEVIDRIVDLHGGPVRLAEMPLKVAQFLLGRARNWARESASLRGASSATHTAAVIASRRAEEIERLFPHASASLGQGSDLNSEETPQ